MVRTYPTDNRELDEACSHQKLKINAPNETAMVLAENLPKKIK